MEQYVRRATKCIPIPSIAKLLLSLILSVPEGPIIQSPQEDQPAVLDLGSFKVSLGAKTFPMQLVFNKD